MKPTKNILVCEDDPVQLKILTTMIDQAGYRPISARTPSEAVIAARRCGVDAVLTDVQLQDGNAFDLLGDLRAIGFDAPVFMASAYATEGMKDRARSAGVKRFFEKPFDLRQIRQQVDEALQASPKLDATILLVEGHDGTRSELEKTAIAAGFDVLAVADGTKALDILLSRSVDLVLMDLHASGANGAKLVRKALEIHPDLHVIMMSGDAARDEIRAGYDAGAASLVRKPVPPARLQSFLKASLKAVRAEAERAEERRERAERHAAEPFTRKFVRWIKSYVHAPSRSRKGGRRITLTLTAASLTIGIGSAYAVQSAYEAADRVEQMIERATALAGGAAASPDSIQLKAAAAMNRIQGAEQLRLMREANEVTRRYYEGHLEELRWQHRNASTPAPMPMPIPAPERAPGKP